MTQHLIRKVIEHEIVETMSQRPVKYKTMIWKIQIYLTRSRSWVKVYISDIVATATAKWIFTPTVVILSHHTFQMPTRIIKSDLMATVHNRAKTVAHSYHNQQKN